MFLNRGLTSLGLQEGVPQHLICVQHTTRDTAPWPRLWTSSHGKIAWNADTANIVEKFQKIYRTFLFILFCFGSYSCVELKNIKLFQGPLACVMFLTIHKNYQLLYQSTLHGLGKTGFVGREVVYPSIRIIFPTWLGTGASVRVCSGRWQPRDIPKWPRWRGQDTTTTRAGTVKGQLGVGAEEEKERHRGKKRKKERLQLIAQFWCLIFFQLASTVHSFDSLVRNGSVHKLVMIQFKEPHEMVTK